jgi:hypothetical protein
VEEDGMILLACAWGIRLLFTTASVLMIARWVIEMRLLTGLA